MNVDLLIDWITEHTGRIGVSFVNDLWTVALEWGQEAPDSPMMGAASYGVGETLDEALTVVLSESGLEQMLAE